MGHDLLAGRYRLSLVVFGLEFTLKQLQRLFKHCLVPIAKEAAAVYQKRFKRRAYYSTKKTKYRQGKVIYRQSHMPEMKNVDTKGEGFPQMSDINNNNNSNNEESGGDVASEHDSDDEVVDDDLDALFASRSEA